MAYSKGNPFAQSPQYWKVSFTLPQVAAGAAQDAFDDLALSVSGFETDEARKLWSFDLISKARPNEGEIARRLKLLASMHGVAAPKIAVGHLERKDWLAEVAQSFPPLSIGRFYIHGAHVRVRPPAGQIAIQVDAGAAFGSGEHGTTEGCLQALDWLSRGREFSRVLDLGCGSGILAIAAAKLWKAEVLAADVDKVAVQVARDNARVNRVTGHVACAVSDGYRGEAVRKAAPFDLIVANILARPLIEFAPDLARNLKKGGVVILSGLLASQEAWVRGAHAAQGLKLEKRIAHGEWMTLVLR